MNKDVEEALRAIAQELSTDMEELDAMTTQYPEFEELFDQVRANLKGAADLINGALFQGEGNANG